MTTILVPTDFSNNAYNALFYATRLLPEGKCKILLVHSYEKELAQELSIVRPTKNEDIVADLRGKIHEKMEAVKHKILLDSKDISLRVECIYGSHALLNMMNKLIDNGHVRCVVMGTKGASGLSKVFLGSQAVSVVKNIAPIPLFLIPKETDFQVPTNVVYATDFKSEYHQKHFDFLKNLVKLHDAKLNVAHVYESMDAESGVEAHYRALEKNFQDQPFSMHWIAKDQGIDKDMTEFCKDQKINLLVLTYHKYSFFQRLLKTSFVEKASFEWDLPLLILPEND